MRRVLISMAVLVATAGAAHAQGHMVQGYVRSNGTYVAPHYHSSPNSSSADNYSAKGNVNPYTGQAGTVNPSPSYGYATPTYSAPRAYVAPTYTAPSYTAPSYGSSYGKAPSQGAYGSSYGR